MRGSLYVLESRNDSLGDEMRIHSYAGPDLQDPAVQTHKS